MGDTLVVFPHDICPVDGTVIEGHGVMDESFLTGEPFKITKAPGSGVISGAVNGQSALTITATRRAVDSRYAKIMEVMRESEQHRPRMRRLGDQLGAFYTPLAVGLAIIAWVVSGEAVRFLAVLVIATPCPLLIAIPVAIIGSISLSARRSIVVEESGRPRTNHGCRTAIFDKTGTLHLRRAEVSGGVDRSRVFENRRCSSSRPASSSTRNILCASHSRGGEEPKTPTQASRPHSASHRAKACVEPLHGQKSNHQSWQISLAQKATARRSFLPAAGGLECIILIDGGYAATYHFRDAPRAEGLSFIKHLGPKHHFKRRHDRLGRPRIGGALSGAALGISRNLRAESPEEKLADRSEEKRREKRSTSATASTMRRR